MNIHEIMLDRSNLSCLVVKGIEPEEEFPILCPLCAEEMVQIRTEDLPPDVRVCVCPLCSLRFSR